MTSPYNDTIHAANEIIEITKLMCVTCKTNEYQSVKNPNSI